MDILIACYSRTGNNALLARFLADKIKADLEEIKGVRDRSQDSAVFRIVIDSLFGLKERIHKPKKKLSNYDLVIICTPAWIGRLPSPLRTYLALTRGSFKKYAIASLSGKGNNPKLIKQVRNLLGRKEVASLELKVPVKEGEDVVKKKVSLHELKMFEKEINEFVKKLKIS